MKIYSTCGIIEVTDYKYGEFGWHSNKETLLNKIKNLVTEEMILKSYYADDIQEFLDMQDYNNLDEFYESLIEEEDLITD